MVKKEENVIRVALRFSGKQADFMRDAKEALGVNTEAEAARYFLGRGIEASATQLASMRMLRRMEERYSPEEMLPLFKKLEGEK